MRFYLPILKFFLNSSIFLVLLSIIFTNELTSSLKSAGILAANADSPIVIVGSGLAGLSAAYSAAINGDQKIIIIDKEGRWGGNSAKATSGINGALTQLQKEKNIEDSYELFIKDTMYSYLGGKQTTEQNELVEKLVYDSSKIVDWLSGEEVNAGLTEMSQLGGHSAKRTHRPKSGVAGKVIVDALKQKVETFANRVEFIFNATLADILIDQKKKEIIGIKYTTPDDTYTIETNALILACGGFANDHSSSSLLSEFAPTLLDIPTTNGLFASGDCVKLARKTVDAKLIDMKEIQLHPTGFIDPADPNHRTKFLAPEALRGLGGILLNNEGKRFVNELDLRSKVVEKIYENSEKFPIYLLLNEKIANTFGPNFNFYWKVKGIFTEYNNLHELADKTGLNETALNQTFIDYEKDKNEGKDNFGKTVFPASFHNDDKLYLSQITPVIHYTMGGLEITKKAEIINNKGEPIKGLFGAGEVTGGVHGKNRLGGNSLLDCGVYGQQAGISAVNYLKEIKVEL